MEAIETIGYNGHTIQIVYDTMPDNPRNWDNLGKMVCVHKRYRLGDEQIDTARVPTYNGVVLPLYLFDHSGVAMSTKPFTCPHADWDSGLVGYIYVTKAKLREEYGKKRISKKLIERVERILRSEVEEYSKYLNGEVYGYIIDNGDSCYGFYSIEDAIQAAKETL